MNYEIAFLANAVIWFVSSWIAYNIGWNHGLRWADKHPTKKEWPVIFNRGAK